MGFVDLHCHILPGLDDGAEDMEESVELLRRSAELGITEIVFTPHYYSERITFDEFLSNRSEAIKKIEPIVNELGLKVRVGAEISFTPILANLPVEQIAYSGTNYLLLELFTGYEPHDVDGLIQRLCSAGYIPILAHIERYPYIEENPQLLYKWVRSGALAQVNAGWILKDKRALKRVKQLYRWNLVHIMASDVHSMRYRPQTLVAGYEKLPEEIVAYFRENAESVFNGKSITRGNPIKPVKWLGHWK